MLDAASAEPPHASLPSTVEGAPLRLRALADEAWQTLQLQAGPMFSASFAYLALTALVDEAGDRLTVPFESTARERIAAELGVALLSQVVGTVLLLGLIKVALEALSGREPTLSDFASGAQRLGAWLAMTVLGSGAVLLALSPAALLLVSTRMLTEGDLAPLALFVVVPSALAGAYVGLGFVFAGFELVHDPRVSGSGALWRAWRITRGHRGRVLGLLAASGLVLALGLCLCGLGLIGAVPYVVLLLGAGYLRLRRLAGLPEGTPRPSAF